MLVHGAFADASGFGAVTSRLQHRGYTVISPANPLRGPASDAASVASVMKTIDGPIVLVAHSYGGAVITEAANEVSNVKALVYLNGLALDEGESNLGITERFPNQFGAALLPRPFPQPDGTQGTDLYIDPARFRSFFAADVPARIAARMASAQRPLSLAAAQENVTEPAWKTIPSWYLIGRQDEVINPAAQRFMAKRATRTRPRSTRPTPPTSRTRQKSRSSSSGPRERSADHTMRAKSAAKAIDMDTFFDNPLGLDPLSPLPSRDHRWFIPAHASASSRTANLSGRQTAPIPAPREVPTWRRAQHEVNRLSGEAPPAPRLLRTTGFLRSEVAHRVADCFTGKPAAPAGVVRRSYQALERETARLSAIVHRAPSFGGLGVRVNCVRSGGDPYRLRKVFSFASSFARTGLRRSLTIATEAPIRFWCSQRAASSTSFGLSTTLGRCALGAGSTCQAEFATWLQCLGTLWLPRRARRRVLRARRSDDDDTGREACRAEPRPADRRAGQHDAVGEAPIPHERRRETAAWRASWNADVVEPSAATPDASDSDHGRERRAGDQLAVDRWARRDGKRRRGDDRRDRKATVPAPRSDRR